MNLTARASLRYLARHRAQCLLAISGIALGVAIVIGIQATQQAARASFAASLRGVFGTATHRISADAGPFDERVLAQVRRLAPALAPAPLVSGALRVERDTGGVSLRLVGIDPIGATLRAGAGQLPIERLMREPGTALLDAQTAARLGIRTGARLEVVSAAGRATLTVLDVLTVDALPGLASDVLVVDIATAQELLALAGRLSAIELESDDSPAARAALAALRADLPPGLELAASGRAAKSARQLTRAFYTNLDALSLLALLVGGFMIYNTMAFLVVQRQTLFARLRALGVSRAALARQVAGEAMLLGAVGGVLGSALGYALAARLLEPFAQTLGDHYHGANAAALDFSPWLGIAGVLIAMLTTLVAALHPAWQAARVPPVVALAAAARDRGGSDTWRLRAALACAVLATALLAFSTRSLYAGFAALAGFLLAAILVAPTLVGALLAILARRLGPHLPLAERLAIKSATRSLGRIGLAVAALMAATATSIGVGLMVASFRVSVTDWLGQVLQADVYVSQELADRAPPLLTPALADDYRALPEVETVSRVRRLRARSGPLEQEVTAYDLPTAARAGFRLLAGEPATAWPAWSRGEAVLVSEPYAWHHAVDAGDTIRLTTPGGTLELPIAGVYTDYGSERGVVAISWPLYVRAWSDDRADGVGLYAAEGVEPAALRTAAERVSAVHPALGVWSNAALRARSLEVFDRTFIVTDVLTVFAAIIAALGVFNALLALHLERAREYAVMRATGCARSLVRRSLYAQTAFVAAAAVMLALPLGVGIAALLIEVINVRSFGWSMALGLDAHALFGPAGLALLAAVAATVYPAERALAITPGRALRYE